MHMIKANLFFGILLCGMLMLAGCGTQKEEPFDYSRYQGEDMHVFLEDFNLTPEDFENFDYGEQRTYQSNDSLPFMDYEGVYFLTCDEQDKIICMEVALTEELKEAESLYEKAWEIATLYEGIETAEYYFDSFEGEPEPVVSTSVDENGKEHESTSYIGVVPSIYNIRKYPAYKDWEEAKETKKINSAVGIWNLEGSVQVNMTYSEERGGAQIKLRFCNSEGQLASPFGNAN